MKKSKKKYLIKFNFILCPKKKIFFLLKNIFFIEKYLSKFKLKDWIIFFKNFEIFFNFK
jgi:hypothetical protein